MFNLLFFVFCLTFYLIFDWFFFWLSRICRRSLCTAFFYLALGQSKSHLIPIPKPIAIPQYLSLHIHCLRHIIFTCKITEE